MSYLLQTNVLTYDALLTALYTTFALGTDGWTGVYNAIADEGSERQIGFEKGNCHIAIGARSTENPIVASGNDARLNMALCTALLSGGGQKKYYGHTGSIVTTATDADRVIINDLGETPYANVWFFSGSAKKHIHVVVQSSAERFSHFSFGILDNLGQTTPDVAYAVSAYHEWWSSGVASNSPASASHKVGHFFENPFNLFVPASVLPAGYPTTPLVYNSSVTQTMIRATTPSDHYQNAAGNILDFFLAVNNATTTGGSAMMPLPVFFQEAAAVSHVLLGVLPDVRLINMAQYTPAQIVKFGTEEWVVFPWKRKGLRENINGGSNPIQIANTIEYGFAYKKTL